MGENVEEEYEEDDTGSRFFGFMFGNVDDSGDLDVDYLDEIKKNFAALSEKLGPAFTDMDLSVKLAPTLSDDVEQDYSEKAENAVNYFDIDEDFEGPEIEGATEEDYLLPIEEYISANVSVDKIREVEDEVVENYDEESEQEEKHEVVKHDARLSLSPPLPVLCVENGEVILRFLEIFGTNVNEAAKRNHRYSVHDSRHKFVDVSHIVEEDEEVFLKGTGEGFTVLKHADGAKHDISKLNDDDFDLTKLCGHKEATSFAQLDGPGKGTYIFGEPMKENLHVDLLVERQSSFFPTIYPFDQDWEEGIIWDKSHVMSDNAVESCEISEHEDALVDSETETESTTGSQHIRLESQKGSDEKRHDIMLCSRSSRLEPFGSRNSVGPLLETIYHPQLLRLESRLEVGDLADGRMKNVNQKLHKRDAVRQFSKFTSHNRDMLEGSWLDQVIWDPNMPIMKPKLILDLEDERMLFEILDNKDSEHLKLHSGARIFSPLVKSSNEDPLPRRGAQFCWRYVANDKHYSNRRTSHQLKLNSKRHTTQSTKIYHSQPAVLLQTMKLKLSNKEVANFHRPKALWCPCDKEKALKSLGELPTQGSMKIIIKSLGGKGSKLHVNNEETVFSVKAKASKKLDFKSFETVKMFYKGRELEDDKSLAAQHVQQNSLLYLVRTKIHLLPRSQKLPGENESLRPPGAFKKKSELSAKDGHVFLVEYCEERPLLLSNIGMGATLCTYYRNSAPDYRNESLSCNEDSSLGHVISLNPADKSPFLGDTKAGFCQSSFETNMYRAPLFPHKVPSTDYLLIRSAEGKLSIRRIDKLNVVGQQQPLMKVMSPGTRDLKNYMLNRLLVYIFREFRAAEECHLPPSIPVDQLRAQFPYLSVPFIINKVKKLVILPKGKNGQWIKKSNIRIFSEDQLRNMVKPEEVCAYESMQAGLYRLKHLGITKTHPSVMPSAMICFRNESIKLAAASHIERELQTTPWNLSSNFIACTMGKENIDHLEISGFGDPSGRGLGFSYVCAVPKSSMSNSVGKKNCATGRGRSDSFSRERCQEIWERQVHSLSAVGNDKNESDSEGNDSDLDSFAGCLENLLDSEECENGLGGEHEYGHDKVGGEGLVMRRLLSLNPAEESEDEAAEAAELCQLLLGDDTEMTKKKKPRLLEEARQPPCSQTSIGFENADRVMKNIGVAQSDGFCTSIENPIGDSKVMDNLFQRNKTGELKGMKENDSTQMHEKIETSGHDVKMFSEKKPAREKFFCGACGQHGHMKTNRKCPKFGLGFDVHFENPDPDNVHGKSISPYLTCQLQQKTTTKKLIPKTVIDLMEPSEVENLSPNSKVVPLTVKVVGEKFPHKQAFGEKESYQNLVALNLETGISTVKDSKMIHYNTTKHGGVSVESHKPPIGIRPPATTVRDQVESKKSSVAKLPLIEAHKEQHHQKRQEKQNNMYFNIEAAKNKARDDRRWGEEKIRMEKEQERLAELKRYEAAIREEKRRTEESAKRQFQEDIRMAKERERLVELKRYEAAIREEKRRTEESAKRQFKEDIRMEKKRERLAQLRRYEAAIREEKRRTEESAKRQFEEEIRMAKERERLTELKRYEAAIREEKRRAEESAKRQIEENASMAKEQERIAELRRYEASIREEKQRIEESAKRQFEKNIRMAKQQERIAELKRYEAAIRQEREEELRIVKKNITMKKEPWKKDDYLEDSQTRNFGKKLPERDQGRKRRSTADLGSYGGDYAPTTKRHKGGEVGLANILEHIVDSLKGRIEISYLFLKPVSRKEAPDYRNIIKYPMDLSTMKVKVRNLEYKSREQFRRDVWQIASNAHRYNDGRNPSIPPLADQLLDFCDYMLVENEESLTEAEAGIEYM